jgi:hypothetical protein
MTTFSENQHPRVSDGTFTDKAQTSPEVSITAPPKSPATINYESRLASFRFAKEDMDRSVVAMMSEATIEAHPTAEYINIAWDDEGDPYASSVTDADGDALWLFGEDAEGGEQAPFNYEDYLEDLEFDPSNPTRIPVTPYVEPPTVQPGIVIHLKGEAPSDEDVDQMLADARTHGNITGRIYSRSSVDTVLDRLLEDEDEDDDVFEASKTDGFREAVWAHVQTNPKWTNLGHQERYDSELDTLDDAVRDGMVAVALERAEQKG